MAPPLQYSCLESPMDGGAWWATVHGVAKSQTRLSDFTFTFHFHALEKEMATHSIVFAWRVPGMGEPGGLPSMGPHRVGHDWSDLAAAVAVNYYLLKYFLMAFLFVFFFWYSYDSNFGSFNIVPDVSEVVISFNYFFSFFLSVSFISTILSSTSLILSSASVILLLVPSKVFLISFIALFVTDWLFSISSRPS